MQRILGVLTGLILFVLALIGVQNAPLITIHGLGWQTGVLPWCVMLVTVLAIGMRPVAVVTVPGLIGRFRTTRRLQHPMHTAAVGGDRGPIAVWIDRTHHASTL